MPNGASDNKEVKMMKEIGGVIKAKLPENFGFSVLCYPMNPEGTEGNPVFFASDTSLIDVVEAMKIFIKNVELDQAQAGSAIIH